MKLTNIYLKKDGDNLAASVYIFARGPLKRMSAKKVRMEVQAIARLIAVAPEMLEALKSWLQFWDAMPKGQLGKIVCNIGFLNEAFQKTTFAIAKAEGKP